MLHRRPRLSPGCRACFPGRRLAFPAIATCCTDEVIPEFHGRVFPRPAALRRLRPARAFRPPLAKPPVPARPRPVAPGRVPAARAFQGRRLPGRLCPAARAATICKRYFARHCDCQGDLASAFCGTARILSETPWQGFQIGPCVVLVPCLIRKPSRKTRVAQAPKRQEAEVREGARLSAPSANKPSVVKRWHNSDRGARRRGAQSSDAASAKK